MDQQAGPYPQGWDSGRLGWGLSICISIKFPGDAMLLGLGPHFENH